MDKWLKEHRKREADCAKTLQGKALLVIDHILTDIGDEDEMLRKLYRIAHCATGVCGCPHEGWVEEVNQTYKELTSPSGL